MVTHRGLNRAFVAIALAALCCTVAVDRAEAQWPQWGGPNRNFEVDTNGLADSWPEEGPRKLWHRELGDGYSSIVVDDGVLYTMYCRDKTECTVALDAQTGSTLWVHENPSPFKGSDYGPGPHATPLVCGDRLFTVGAKTMMHCLDKRTGKVLWQHDLAGEFGAPVPQYGYACSPIAYKNLVIIPVDRERPKKPDGAATGEQPENNAPDPAAQQSLTAFDQATGKVVWQSQDFPIDYSSPILIDFEGQDQVVALLRTDLIGVDPSDGALLWRLEFSTAPLENISTPLFNGSDLLFLSAAYDSGSRAIRLSRKEGKTVPEELWYSRKMRIHLGNAIGIGDHVYASSGDFGSVLFVCMDLRTGKRVWADRSLGKSTLVYADGKLIALDEQGELALASVSPKGLTVHSRCKVTEHQSWTAPTLVGKTLFVRDRKHIMALDLG
jgi:outer membrane protein assembly factor BamB